MRPMSVYSALTFSFIYSKQIEMRVRLVTYHNILLQGNIGHLKTSVCLLKRNLGHFRIFLLERNIGL